jgi:hypothetical protein
MFYFIAIQGQTIGSNVDGGERPQYLLCMKILTANSTKQNKVKRHF